MLNTNFAKRHIWRMVSILLAISFICFAVFYFYDRNRIQIVSGTIRFSDSEWHLISDDEHTALNVTNVTTKDSGDIIVNYGFKAKKVISFVVCPDETLARYGVTCGASVDLERATIQAYVPSGQAGEYKQIVEVPPEMQKFSNIWFYGMFLMY